MRISILSIGNEILDGRVQDTNSNYIARSLSAIGIELKYILSCGDTIDEITGSLQFLAPLSDIIITSGGLGPTTDDVTRDAIAAFAGVPVEQDKDSLKRLEEKFVARKRNFNPENNRQTFFPKGAEILPNSEGTADGFCLSKGALKIFSIPGVPAELYPMLQTHILPTIKTETVIHKKAFKIFGLPEAQIGKKIRELHLDSSITVSYRASMPEVEVTLKSLSPLSKKIVQQTEQAIGPEFIFSNDTATSFPEYVSKLLVEEKLTLSVAESCTGGMLGSYLTQTPGISQSFLGGIIAYSNQVKDETLQVSQTILKQHGAVSDECAKAMARGCVEKFNSDFAVSITGIAGPGGGSDEKPVGTFFIGIADRHGNISSQRFFMNSNRASIRKYASYVALDVLRRKIVGLPNWDYFSPVKPSR